MTNSAVESLERFCHEHGVALPFEAQPIRAGRNSAVFKLRNSDGQWILKNYYQSPNDDRRDRLGTEYDFLVFLKNAGFTDVPRPLGMDRTLNLALYSHLPGWRPSSIGPVQIGQAAAFVRRINKLRGSTEARALAMASDACLSWQAHMDLAESRIDRLLAIKPELPVGFEAREFVQTRLMPLWIKVKIKLMQMRGAPELSALLPPEERVISPSDFGFHNTLEDAGHLYFVDFEYAGWDDPAKLICDFMCQPELPVSEEQGRQFMNEVSCELSQTQEAVKHRVESLLPVHRMKWCCILLNEFKTEDRNRRMHAGLNTEGLLVAQFEKAEKYFNTHLAALI